MIRFSAHAVVVEAENRARRSRTLHEVGVDVEGVGLEDPAGELLHRRALEVECGIEVRIDAEPRRSEEPAHGRHSGSRRRIRRKAPAGAFPPRDRRPRVERGFLARESGHEVVIERGGIVLGDLRARRLALAHPERRALRLAVEHDLETPRALCCGRRQGHRSPPVRRRVVVGVGRNRRGRELRTVRCEDAELGVVLSMLVGEERGEIYGLSRLEVRVAMLDFGCRAGREFDRSIARHDQIDGLLIVGPLLRPPRLRNGGVARARERVDQRATRIVELEVEMRSRRIA